MYFTVNYGQYWTICDRYFGSYRQPNKSDDPMLAVLAKTQKAKSAAELAQVERQAREMAAAQAQAESKKIE
jgi:lathosterol oxidase